MNKKRSFYFVAVMFLIGVYLLYIALADWPSQ